MSDSMSEARKSLADSVKKSAQFFELDITIKIFGVEILHLHFPPKTKCDDC